MSGLPVRPAAVLDAIVLTLGGVPLHPLVIHAVVVLLPLAAVGTLAMAVRPVWRRSLGVPTLLVALVGVVAVPMATYTGNQLQVALNGGSPLVAEHASRAGTLLPVAIAFGVLLLAAVVVDRMAGARTAVGAGAHRGPAARVGPAPAILTALAALAGIASAGLVVWIGHAGASAVWLA